MSAAEQELVPTTAHSSRPQMPVSPFASKQVLLLMHAAMQREPLRVA